MANTRVVAISGPARAGKDTVAQILIHHHVGAVSESLLRLRRADVFSFAAPLKQMTRILLGLAGDAPMSDEEKLTLRPWLINLGGDIRRRDPYAWVDHTIRRIRAWVTPADSSLAVIPDLRYFNELGRLCEQFGADVRLIRIQASTETRRERMGAEVFDEYVRSGMSEDDSETQMNLLDCPIFRVPARLTADVQAVRGAMIVLSNEGTTQQLEAQVVRCLDAFDGKLNGTPAGSGKDLARACYRIARHIGPEDRLLLSESAPDGEAQ